jgi:hypothetical protein
MKPFMLFMLIAGMCYGQDYTVTDFTSEVFGHCRLATMECRGHEITGTFTGPVTGDHYCAPATQNQQQTYSETKTPVKLILCCSTMAFFAGGGMYCFVRRRREARELEHDIKIAMYNQRNGVVQ